MTCDDVREWLLAAEPSELSTVGDRAVATHLRSCATCRARVARVASDTALLVGGIVSVGDRPRVRPLAGVPVRTARERGASRRRTRALAAGLLAASLIIAVAIAAERRGQSSSVAATRVATKQADRSPAAAAQAAAPGAMAPDRANDALVHGRLAARARSEHATRRGAATRAATRAAHSPESNEVVPALAHHAPLRSTSQHSPPFDAGTIDRPALEVEPDSTHRIAVLRASPTVTVVWFY